MNKIGFVFLVLVILFGANFCYSQCCCSSVYFKVLDKKKKPIPKEKLEVQNLTKRLQFSEDYKLLYNYPDVYFDIHCGAGDEVISLKYKGKEMLLYLNLRGDFGFAKSEFKFEGGKFLAEFDKGMNQTAKTFRIRKMIKDELEYRKQLENR
jgi:hypothetical protein